MSLKEPTFFILAALAGGEAHGYRLLTAIEELSEGRLRLRAGTLYGALDRLERDGRIELQGVQRAAGRPAAPTASRPRVGSCSRPRSPGWKPT